MNQSVQLKLPPKLVDVFLGGADYRGAYGGRGSGKSHSFAKMTAARGLQLASGGASGVIVCGREFQNTLSESSFAEVKYAIQSEPWLAEAYEVGDNYVRTRDRRIEYAFAGLRHNLDSIKSKSRILLLWVDEAEPVSEEAWRKALPTVREEGSETWITWNPESERSATHLRFRQSAPPRSKIVELNWRDNPWFTDKLNRQRLDDKKSRPDTYAHVWEGAFATSVSGAYYAALLLEAQADGRIARLGRDPLMQLRAWWDIGGTGARADACAIWVGQYVGDEIRMLDYYEAIGQPLAAHVSWLRERGYGKAHCVLPHDGAQHEKVINVTYESALRAAEFTTTVIPNMGAGAAKMRIEAARRLFPSIAFDAERTRAGRVTLGMYHEKRDERRGMGLGPEHDYASHCADAFGLMAIDYQTHKPKKWQPIKYPKLAIV